MLCLYLPSDARAKQHIVESLVTTAITSTPNSTVVADYNLYSSSFDLGKKTLVVMSILRLQATFDFSVARSLLEDMELLGPFDDWFDKREMNKIQGSAFKDLRNSKLQKLIVYSVSFSLPYYRHEALVRRYELCGHCTIAYFCMAQSCPLRN